MMKRSITILAILFSVTLAAAGQAAFNPSRSNRITRPCAASATAAKAAFDRYGNFDVFQCTNRVISIGNEAGTSGVNLRMDDAAGEIGFRGASVDFYEGAAFQDGSLMFLAGSDGFVLDRTITAAGTTGNQTINKMAGTVNVAAAAGAAGITVTNSQVTANSIVIAIARTNDATCHVKNVVAAAGSFVIRMDANCTAETSVGFLVLN